MCCKLLNFGRSLGFSKRLQARELVTEKIAGRTCRTSGPENADKVLILFHGLTQGAAFNPMKYTDFPRHTELLSEPAAATWRLIFPDGGNRHWDQNDDLKYVLQLFDETILKYPNAKICIGGFSMGSFPVGWLMLHRRYQIHKALIHSGLWSDNLKNDVPIMGVITVRESVPWAPWINFDGMMQPQYNWAAKNLPLFVHGYESGNHRVPGIVHQWWTAGSPRMLKWLEEDK